MAHVTKMATFQTELTRVELIKKETGVVKLVSIILPCLTVVGFYASKLKIMLNCGDNNNNNNNKSSKS